MYKFTVGIDGMMCSMCESHINKTVRDSFNVNKVTSSHSKNRTVIISEDDIDESDLRAAINKTGYQVTSVSREPYEKKGLLGIFKK
jgi:copper chaperone CopZ